MNSQSSNLGGTYSRVAYTQLRWYRHNNFKASKEGCLAMRVSPHYAAVGTVACVIFYSSYLLYCAPNALSRILLSESGEDFCIQHEQATRSYNLQNL
jgi:hypothetical protein